MSYTFTEEVLYSIKFYIVNNNGQQVNVAYYPTQGHNYMMIIFAEDGNRINTPHDPRFLTLLNEIHIEFHSVAKADDYEVIAP